MASGQQITVKLMRGDNTSWGFRLQGGKDFAIPLSVVKVNPSSLADQAGLCIGDIIISIGDRDAELMRHKEAQDAIVCAGNYLTMTVQRGETTTWRPNVTPVGDVRPGQNTYTSTSLKKDPQQATKPIGSGHNVNAKPFMGGGNVPALVHKQYNSPVNLYSEKSIAETLEAHTEVLTSGAMGINFMRPDAPINKDSAVYQMVHDEEQRKTKGGSASTSVSPDVSSLRSAEQYSQSTRHVEAPIDKPASERQTQANQNICAECERLIIGVFVRVKDKSLHAECFRCATCGTSLKNVGYFTINDKLYCDIHAKQVASFMNVNGSILPVPAPNGVSNSVSPNPPSISLTTPTPPSSSVGPMPYHSTQGVHQFNSSSNLQYSAPKKYSPVPPPVAPKPAFKAMPTPTPTPNPTSLYGNSLSNQTDGYADGYRPFSGRPKPIWSPAPSIYDQTGDSRTSAAVDVYNFGPDSLCPGVAHTRDTFNRDCVRRERPRSLYSSFPMSSNVSSNIVTSDDFKRTSSFASFPPTGSPSVATYATSFATVQTKVPPMTAPKPQINTQSWTTGSPYCSSTMPGPGQSLIPGSRPAPRRGRGTLKMPGSTIPICGSCGSPIRGPFIIALNKTWCPHHFICANNHCNRSLEEVGFVEENGKLYCENCYESCMAPLCSKCSQRIKGDCLNALERQWHPECFSCAYCKRPFGNSSFYMEDGLPYCEKDWNELFTTKCVGCGFAIEAGDRWVEALNQNYHSNCFMCTVCHKNLEGQSFYAKNGRPFCKSHAR